VAASLPRLHGDPFDRMLIAQAQAESALLLTRDVVLTAYGGFVTLG
jgi:PIN domain nuclease of toxin-antitoxin system